MVFCCIWVYRIPWSVLRLYRHAHYDNLQQWDSVVMEGKWVVYRRNMVLWDVASCNWVDICTVVSEVPAVKMETSCIKPWKSERLHKPINFILGGEEGDSFRCLISSSSSSSSSVTSYALTDLLRSRLVVYSKIFQCVFVHFVYDSSSFLPSCCCSFLSHVVANFICIFLVPR